MTVERKGSKQDLDEREKFLGYLASAAELWKLLLIVPVIVAALTYWYLSARPSLYRSEAILRLTKDEVAILKSARLLDAVVKKVSISPEATASVAISSPDSPDISNVGLTYGSAAGAATVLQELMDRLSDATMPSTYNRVALENRIKVLNEAQTNLEQSLTKVNSLFDRIPGSGATAEPADRGGDYGQSFAQLIYFYTRNDADIAATKAALLPTFTVDDVIEPPTVPTKPIARRISPFVTLAFVLSFGVLLVLVIARDALRHATSSPNLIRVRRALRPWARS